ncbi:hypothetical protein [Bifidobacterium castoris]|nr:hypothetical protein [Bifidobacterium castoris]
MDTMGFLDRLERLLRLACTGRARLVRAAEGKRWRQWAVLTDTGGAALICETDGRGAPCAAVLTALHTIDGVMPPPVMFGDWGDMVAAEPIGGVESLTAACMDVVGLDSGRRT